ncbi:MAG: tRNA (adenine(22)-N(1))-methyltransferase TrmK [Lachnospiraceae bacterium]|nr:tRNA (adenine(22)-N(1))-methyltransferase TrmK [Lachnospiraceae bacterium]
MALSKRLECILSLVPEDVHTAADIGTDHGLVPLALIRRGLCKRVIATDLREGPLKAARELFAREDLQESVELRLGDGLAPLLPGEADLIVMAGMGGALMQKILRDGRQTAAKARRLILSPQSELPAFRRFLQKEKYHIDRERLVEEEGKYYSVFSLTPGLPQDLSEEEIEFGKNLCEDDKNTLRDYLNKALTRDQWILQQITGSAGAATLRIQEVEERLIRTAKALHPLTSTTAKGRKNMSSKLGFGLMRLPRLEDGSIDIKQSSEMVDLFLEKGGTYFDTAYVYEGSEEATKKILVDRHPRNSYTLATKMNTMVQPRTKESTLAQFYTSLERTGAEYFDYYLLHALGAGNTPLHNEFDTWQFVADRKAEGLVKKMGFSFHDTPEFLEGLLKDHPEVDFVQLQINYADWDNPDVQSRRIYEVARRHGKEVVVMEPVKGGTLATLPEAAEKLFKAADPAASLASWAIRYVASKEGMLAVLSGMSTLEQVRDNMSYMGEGCFKPLDEKEEALIEEVRKVLASQRQIGCTACKYCTEGCPMQINIPGIFSAYNMYLRFENLGPAKGRYNMRTREGGKASDCVACGACEDACPQHLPIRDLLAEAAGVLEG